MLGGFHTFGPGGYQDTPLADLLPVDDGLQRTAAAGRSRFAPTCSLPGPLKMRPAKPLGERHYLMALAEGADRDNIWDQLPPLEGANKLGPAQAERAGAGRNARRQAAVGRARSRRPGDGLCRPIRPGIGGWKVSRRSTSASGGK